MPATILFFLYCRYCRIASRYLEAKIAQSNLILEVDAVEQAVARKGLKCWCCQNPLIVFGRFCIYFASIVECGSCTAHCDGGVQRRTRVVVQRQNPSFLPCPLNQFEVWQKTVLVFLHVLSIRLSVFSVLWSSEHVLVLEPVLVLPLLLPPQEASAATKRKHGSNLSGLTLSFFPKFLTLHTYANLWLIYDCSLWALYPWTCAAHTQPIC